MARLMARLIVTRPIVDRLVVCTHTLLGALPPSPVQLPAVCIRLYLDIRLRRQCAQPTTANATRRDAYRTDRHSLQSLVSKRNPV